MIFVTVGAQMPFDRLVRAVDAWAAAHADADVFAQIGQSGFRPEHIAWTRFLDPPDFAARIAAADLIVSHAGTGSIISALGQARPILVMPRRCALRETRNDHQLATVSRLCDRPGISVAMDEGELIDHLDRISSLPAPERLCPDASDDLIDAVSEFIYGSCRKV